MRNDELPKWPGVLFLTFIVIIGASIYSITRPKHSYPFEIEELARAYYTDAKANVLDYILIEDTARSFPPLKQVRIKEVEGGDVGLYFSLQPPHTGDVAVVLRSPKRQPVGALMLVQLNDKVLFERSSETIDSMWLAVGGILR